MSVPPCPEYRSVLGQSPLRSRHAAASFADGAGEIFRKIYGKIIYNSVLIGYNREWHYNNREYNAHEK